MSARRTRNRLPHTLLTLLVASLLLLTASLAAGAAGRRGSHHGAPHARQACRMHVKHARHARHAKRRVRGCLSRVHRRKHHAAPRQTLVRVPPQAQPVDAAVIAAVLATPCANTELTPAADNLQAVAAATFCLVNQERARHGEMPLRLNGDLEQAAYGHSREMVSQDYFAHISPDGLTPLARVRGTGYIPSPHDGYTIGENIAWGTLELSTPRAIVAAWIASPEHLANILEAQYRDTAIGVEPQAPASLSGEQHGAVYTQEFGVIVG